MLRVVEDMAETENACTVLVMSQQFAACCSSCNTTVTCPLAPTAQYTMPLPVAAAVYSSIPR